jgi:hypothetical protein
VLQQIGAGCFGVVCMAEEEKPGSPPSISRYALRILSRLTTAPFSPHVAQN